MGDLVAPNFGQKRPKLTGFIPEGLGQEAMDRRRQDQIERDRQIELIAFARMGRPPIISGPPNHPDAFNPDDCA